MVLDELYFAKGLDPVADAFAGTVRSDVIDASLFNKLVFIIHKGVGTTGTSVITVQSSDDTSPMNETAVPFKYRAVTSADTQGAVTQAAAAGFTLTAGSSQVYAIEVDPQDLASTGRKYCNLKAVEDVDAAVLAGITVIGWPKHAAISESAVD